jgi:hypothetical protein
MKKLYPTAKIGLRKKVNPEKLKFAKELRKNPTVETHTIIQARSQV